MKLLLLCFAALIFSTSVATIDADVDSVEGIDPEVDAFQHEPEIVDDPNDYTPYEGPPLCRGEDGRLGPCGQRRAAKKCPGKCVPKPRLRQGNAANRCGIQYGCVTGCCRHSTDQQVADGLRRCTGAPCTFTHQICVAPCVCYAPGGQWIQGVNTHMQGHCGPRQ